MNHGRGNLVHESMSALPTYLVVADTPHTAALSNSAISLYVLNGKCLVGNALWDRPGGLKNISLDDFTHGPLRNTQIYG